MASNKSMAETRKKGFTVVELLVVLAIIAVVASVSLIGYVGFIEDAKRSVDEQFAAQMNIMLSAQEVLQKPAHVSEVQELFEAESITDFSTKSKNCKFYWIATLNRVVLWEFDGEDGEYGTQGKVVFPLDQADENITELQSGWYALTSTYLQPSDGAPELFELIKNAKAKGDTIAFMENTTMEVDGEALGTALKDREGDSSGKKSITLDLNGGTLQVGKKEDGGYYPLSVSRDSRLEIVNGNVELQGDAKSRTPKSYISVQQDASLLLRNVNLTAVDNGIMAHSNAFLVEVINSEINSGNFAIYTEHLEAYEETLKIAVSNSKIDGNTAVLVNAECNLSISNSTVIGHNQAIILRGGTATLINNEIYNYFAPQEEAATSWNYFMHDFVNKKYVDWQDGNMVPLAAITIGNDVQSEKYQYPSACVMENNTIHVIEGYMAIYIEGMSEENNATLTVSGGSYFYYQDDTYQDEDKKPFGQTEPKEYAADMTVIDAPIIYSSDSESYVTINGVEY